MRLLSVLIVCVMLAAASGASRFGAPGRVASPLVDVVFLIACAFVVGCVVLGVVRRMESETHRASEAAQSDGLVDALRKAKESGAPTDSRNAAGSRDGMSRDASRVDGERA